MPDESPAYPDLASSPHSIARISVEKLFGQFTYQLPIKNGAGPVLSNLFILYGDNGSGKTTILKLLFQLLSPEDGKGYKAAIAKVRFRRFAVELADGTTIEALRPGKSQEGFYRAAILKGGETLDAMDFPAGFRTGGEIKEDERARARSFLEKLAGFRFGLHFLPDDRRIQGKETDSDEMERWRYRAIRSAGSVFIGNDHVEDDSPSATLKAAVSRAAGWIRQQAFVGSNRGQRGVDSIYTDITKHIVDTSEAQVPPDAQQQQVDKLAVKLQALSEQSKAFAKFGLTSELPVDPLLAFLQRGTPETRPILYNVLRPYVQSIEARLNAMETIHTLVQRFVENINMFFGSTKHVSYDLRLGFEIRTKSGEKLDLEMLSSGERQLLLLMCNTLAARDNATIVIIDEPEISLNVKWQRRLVQALLDCITGSNAQLIFATHSIELLAQHKSQVVKLEDLSDGEKPSRIKEKRDEPRREADVRGIGSEV